MKKKKYIVIETAEGFEVPIVFADTLQHGDVARGVGGKVLGAGFVEFFAADQCEAQTYGRSDSLNIAPRGEDAALLERELLGAIRG